MVFSPFDWTGDSSGARELVHTGRKVTITTALLRPPWADTFLILKDKKAGHVRVGTSDSRAGDSVALCANPA